jgi:hypothetical protein
MAALRYCSDSFSKIGFARSEVWALQQPVDGQRGVPVRGEPRTRPLRPSCPHLDQLGWPTQQFAKHLGERRRAFVPGGCPGDPVQVGIRGAAVRRPDNRGARYLRLKQRRSPPGSAARHGLAC